MPLSIRNPRAAALAREVAGLTGETLTEAVVQALDERLERLRGRRTPADLCREILDIAARCRALPDLDRRTPDQILGYDEHGVPTGGA
jgi:antitoxin VapB